MSNARRCATGLFLFVSILIAGTSFAAEAGKDVAKRTASKARPNDAGVYFSGSYSYGIGGGVAILKADNVTNPNGTATGPLRFSLWFTPTAFPSAGTNTASYDITSSLAAGQSISPINGGNTTVPFTDPPTGCYYVTLVLEENVGGTWTTRDYGSFSLSFDIGSGCITSFTSNPATVASGGTSTLSWTTTGSSVSYTTIDHGLGTRPANGSVMVNPTITTFYTLRAYQTANYNAPSKVAKVTVPGTWTPVGIEGGVIFGFAIDPTTPSHVFAATLNGAFRSTDSGVTWNRVFGLECAGIAVHPTNSSIVFLTDRNRQVYKSTDGGQTFALSSNGISLSVQGTIFGKFAFQSGNPNVMYYAWPRGLFKSIDGGANWTASDAGAVNNQSVVDLALDSTNSQIVYLALSTPGIYKSVDGGATWNPFNTGLPSSASNYSVFAFAQDPTSPQLLYMLSGRDFKVYASSDGAATWNVRSTNALGSMTSLVVAPGNGQILFAGGKDTSGGSPTYRNGIYKSVDSGVTWTNTSSYISGSYFRASALAMPPASGGTLYASLGTGLSKTTDGASTWTAMNSGLRGEEADYRMAFWPTSSSIWYVQYQQSGVMVTTDGGATMFSENGNLATAGIGAIVIDPTNPSILLAAGGTAAQAAFNSAYTNFLVRTTNGGITWTPVNNPNAPTSTNLQAWGFVTYATNPTTYFVMGASDGVYKSTDAGVTFTAAKTGLPTSSVIFRGIAAADNSATTLYCATTNGFFKTSNGGASWATPGTGLPSGSYVEVAVNPSAPQRVLALHSTGLYITTDSGATWNAVAAANFPSVPGTIAMSPSSPATVYASGSTTNGTTRTVWVYRSLDGGGTWNALTSQGLDVISSFSMSVDPSNPNHIYTGSRGGLSEFTVPPPTVSSVSPATGNVAGSTFVTITGANFAYGASVTFDGIAATNVAFVNSTTLTASTPAHATGAVNVVVSNADGQSGTLNSGFTYSTALAAPANLVATATTTTQVNLTWNASAGATSYQVYRRSSTSGGSFSLINSPGTNSYNDTSATAGNAYSYVVRAVNASTSSADSAQDLAITIFFTDDPLTAHSTIVKAVHLSQLRTAANAVRSLAGVTAFSFTGPATTGTTITATQINELRTALDGGLSVLGRPTGGYTDTITAGVTIKAVHVQEIRDRMK